MGLLWVRASTLIFTRSIQQEPKGFRSWYKKTMAPAKGPQPPFKHFVQIGDPVLRANAELVNKDDIKSNEIQNVIQNLKAVLKKYDGIGASAPQIGIPVQIVAFQFTPSQLSNWGEETIKECGMEVIPFKVFINPVCRVINNKMLHQREGCCSVQGFSAIVPRAKEVVLTGLDQNAEEVSWHAKDWSARMIQHEMDHLKGKMFTDVMDKQTFMFNYWNVVNHREGDFRFGYSGVDGIKAKILPFSIFKQPKS